jgi:hypothetical protein
MAGVFSKNYNLTPAQQLMQQTAMQEAQKNEQFWFPIQQYFANRVQQTAPAQKELAKGEAADTSKAQAEGMIGQTVNRDTVTGARPGSGKYLLDASGGYGKSAIGSSLATQSAGAASDRSYVQGLQQVVQAGGADMKSAQQGLQLAGQGQAQEAGIETQGGEAALQGAGEVAGLAAAVLA